MRGWRGVVLIVTLSLSACSKTPTTQVTPTEDEDNLHKPIEVSVVGLLDKSRRDLSALDDEFNDRVTFQNKVVREKPPEALLLDRLRYPLEIPIWQQAKYHADSDLSLPPYLAPGSKDRGLAWHLARHGDLEAARKLAEPGQEKELIELHQSLYERNYPVEWSRLVARLQQLGHLRLITGELDGATLLIEVHAQLRTALDPRARTSPLGAALLRPGRTTLTQAEAAWRAAKKPNLADQVKTVLDGWGEVPTPEMAVWLGKPRSELAALLGSAPSEGAILIDDPRRTLDVLALPVAREQAEGLALTFDNADRLRDIVLCYQPGVSRLHSGASSLAFVLEEHGIRGQDLPDALDIRSRRYPLGDAVCEVRVLLQNPHVGAVVCFRAERPSETARPLRRDFGLIHLDAGFEFNRHQLNPQLLGDSVEGKDRADLDDLQHPVPALNPLVLARIARAPKATATDRLVLMGDKRRVPLHRLAGPLWQEAGLGVWKGVEEKEGGHFALSWEDDKTTYTLRLPLLSTRVVEWEAADKAAGTNQETRDQAAEQFDLARRKERMENKVPWDELPRSLQVHTFKLGDPRSLVQKAIPQAEKTPYGLRYLFPDKPAATDASTTGMKGGKAPVGRPGARPTTSRNSRQPAAKVEEPEYTPRQLLLRFDKNDRLAEVRLFLQENTARAGSMTAKYQALFGVNPPVESSWKALWKDLPPMKPEPLLNRWRDDQTLFTCQRAGFGTELAIRDCPLDHPEGVPLPEMTNLARGPDEVKLDQTRDEVLAGWKGTPPKPVAEDPLILEPSRPGRFDAFYLWFAQGKVIRVVARHSVPTTRLAPADRTRAITTAWGPLLGEAGFWVRCDLAGDKTGQYVQSYGWADDRTRVRLFWQDENGTPRLFTEWMALTKGD